MSEESKGMANEGTTYSSPDIGTQGSESVQSEIDAMFDALSFDETPIKEAKEGAEESEKAESGDGINTSEERESSPEDEGEHIDASSKESDGEGESEETEDPRDKKIEDLTNQLQELSQRISQLLNEKAGKEEVKGSDAEPDDFEEIKKDLVSEFINSEEEFDQAFDKKEKMNEILRRVQESSIQSVLSSIPRIINRIVPQYVQMYQKTNDFYNKHPDLKPHAQFVGQVTNDLVSKNPDWDMDKVFSVLGGDDKDIGEVRRRLGLKKTAESADKKKSASRPAFGKAQSTRTSGEEVKLTGIEKQIADMLESVGL